ncbi:hypothetical protein HDU85_002114 [Gaertneriomyces sp. JEL0708]|nr:hypothetical protein HDU85_002114 [Gaertneriomyces sp. JEL0708]
MTSTPNLTTEILTHEPWPFTSRRSITFSRKALIAGSQPLAVQAGLLTLQKGGNAADAAVTVAACLNVTEPGSTGIGGDCFCLFYDATTRQVRALNGSGRAPGLLSLEYLKSVGVTTTSIPLESALAVTVPGAAAGWVDVVDAFGSGKVDMRQVLAPAIELAEQGFMVSDVSAHIWQTSEEKLKRAGAEELLVGGVRAPVEGEVVRSPGLAKTFRKLAEEGKDGFYKGEVAEAIVETLKSRGGVMTLEDLANHTSTPTGPISIDYGNIRLHEHSPNGQGLVALQALGIIKELEAAGTIQPLHTYNPSSPEYLHILIEALRLAFADGRHWIADPDVVNVPVSHLLDRTYLSHRAQLFNPTHAATDITNGTPQHACDTVYFAVVDEHGNACSFINSLYHSFGTGIVAKGTGVALQSRGNGFSVVEGALNCVAPGKRPYHTIIPAMVTDRESDALVYCYGCMGGFMQPQGHLQILLTLLHHTPSPQHAIDTPRFCIAPDTGIVYLEEGIDDQTVQGLKDMGHVVQVKCGRERALFGRAQVIERVEGGWRGGSDPRGDGMCVPLV